MIFKKASAWEEAHQLHSLYLKCKYKISDYSAGIKQMWEDVINPEFAISHGCLLSKECYNGRVSFSLPFPVEEEADISAAIVDVATYCRENFLPLRFDYVPKDKLSLITDIYPLVDVSLDNSISDYIYLAEDFRKFSGKKYAGQRNHVRKFKTNYPEAVFKLLESSDIPLIEKFFEKFKSGFTNSSEGALDELHRAEETAKSCITSNYIAGGFILNEELISFCLTEICGDTAINHIEKAFSNYEGIYPATAQAFAEVLPPDVIYLNREDDAGVRGLRTSKLQYHPTELLKKYSVTVKNELHALKGIPHIETERLILDAIMPYDKEAYFRLCTDDERNKYWGYDYREANPNPKKGFFYLDQRTDFENRTAMNFAIRYKGKFAGEVIIYNFDFEGKCELGVRILPEFDKRGIGKEALLTAANYTIYSLGVDAVTAKCFKENTASEKMLSSLMKKCGEDETYFYFMKNV